MKATSFAVASAKSLFGTFDSKVDSDVGTKVHVSLDLGYGMLFHLI